MDEDNTRSAWRALHSEAGPDLGIFQVRYDWVQNPRNAFVMKAVVLEMPAWVNVVAVTPDHKILVIDQYRFGVGRTTTEIPAGVVNPGETSLEAARRELQEETGYTTTQWTYLGWVEPNPAIQNNQCHQWVAWDVQQSHALALDEGEDIVVRLVSPNDLRREIQAGTIRNALALLALSRVVNLWDASQDEAAFLDKIYTID
jgi:ADP-ribose pyrophosphatase